MKIILTTAFSALIAVSAIAAGDDADNTRQNAGDGSAQELTPIDQGNDSESIDLTAAIRKAIIADDELSMNAKNSKIITADGVTTLRGVVDSSAEKAKIEALAKEAGATNIQNQLTVNTDTNE